jgi:hypothetical protein
MFNLVRNDDVVKKLIRGFVLETDLKDKDNLDYIRRLRTSISFECIMDEAKVGFMIVSVVDDKKYDFIESIYTTLRGQNIAQRMMMQYKNMFHKELIPYEIAEKSTEYWYKMYCRNGIDDIKSLIKYLASYDLKDPSKIK